MLLAGQVFTVTTELDVVAPDDNLVSLREAVTQANQAQDPDPAVQDTILFDNGLANKPVRLLLGQITITDPVVIQGPSGGLVIVDGQNNSRLFDLPDGAGNVVLEKLHLIGGKTTADSEGGGAIRSGNGNSLTILNSVLSSNSTTGENAPGGAVFSMSEVVVSNSSLTNNSTLGNFATGGAIHTHSLARITNSIISHNFTEGGAASGGGIHSQAIITSSTISGNSTAGANANGGGLYAEGLLTISSSTFSVNFTAGASSSGGAFSSNGHPTVVNSTFAENYTLGNASGGGAIFSYRSLHLINSTVVGNSVAGAESDGGGISTVEGPLIIRNSIVDGNLDTQDGDSPELQSVGLNVAFSLIGNNTGTALAAAPVGSPDANGNLVGTDAAFIDALLAPLSDVPVPATGNGGNTPTREPTPGSPVVEAGKNSLAVDPVTQVALTRDQRGLARVRDANAASGARVDMGAVEVSPPTIGGFSNAVSYTENAASSAIAANATVTDLDTDDLVGGRLIIALTEGVAAVDRLGIRNAAAVTTAGTDLLVGGVKLGTFSGGNGTTPLAILFSAATTPAQAQAVLRAITFRAQGDAPSAFARTVRCQLVNCDGATSAAVTKQITVTLRNDAPVLSGEPATLNFVVEDTPNPFGTLVSTFASPKITDADAAPLKGIAVVSLTEKTKGTWQFSTDSGTSWQNFGAPSDTAARLLAPSNRVRFVPSLDYNGTPQLLFRAWDQSDGLGAAAVVNTTGKRGGTGPISENSLSARLTVTSVNDRPVLTLSGSVGYVRNAPAIALAPNATLTDVDSANFDGGQLFVDIVQGRGNNNTLAIGGSFTVDASNNVKHNGVTIGNCTVYGTGTNGLNITFNNNATKAIVEQLIRAITYKNVGGSAGERRIYFLVSDGDGGSSDVLTKTVHVT